MRERFCWKGLREEMPTPHASRATRPLRIPNTEFPVKHSWRRVLILSTLLVLSIVLYIVLIAEKPPNDLLILPFLLTWIICFVPYFAACAFVFLTRPQSGRWRWLELGLIFGGAVIFRAMLLPLPPGLSHDSWRYLWDARVTLHGYSPYVYAPGDAIFKSMRDFIFANSRYRNAPTIYPPGAQFVFLLSYLLVPSNLFFLKGIFMIFDLVTCVALALLLAHRGMDPRRVIIYAWCPLPIVEFAIQGHVDVITLTFMVLTVLCASSTFRGSRVLTGFLIGMATLTKIYPIFLIVVVIHRRDWALIATCIATIVLSYLPYYILGNGQVFGFFAKYADQQGGNAGIIQLVIYWISFSLHFKYAVTLIQQHVIEALFAGLMALIVLIMRIMRYASMEASTLFLTGVVFAISSHVFPWYATALLPWIAVLAGSPWTSRSISGKGLAVMMAWYFACISITGYFFNTTVVWQPYYQYAYDVVLIGLALALAVGFRHELQQLYRKTLEGSPRESKSRTGNF
jgi:hypothetical protein